MIEINVRLGLLVRFVIQLDDRYDNNDINATLFSVKSEAAAAGKSDEEANNHASWLVNEV